MFSVILIILVCICFVFFYWELSKLNADIEKLYDMYFEFNPYNKYLEEKNTKDNKSVIKEMEL